LGTETRSEKKNPKPMYEPKLPERKRNWRSKAR